MTADTLTSSMIYVPIRTVSQAKVMADDLVNFQSRPGSLNTLWQPSKALVARAQGQMEPRKMR